MPSSRGISLETASDTQYGSCLPVLWRTRTSGVSVQLRLYRCHGAEQTKIALALLSSLIVCLQQIRKLLPQSWHIQILVEGFRQICRRAAERFLTAYTRGLSEISIGPRAWAVLKSSSRLGYVPCGNPSSNDIQRQYPESTHRPTSREAVEHQSSGCPQGD